MKKVTSLLIVLALFSSLAFSQDEAKSSIAAGSKALLFQFSGFSNLGAGEFEGGIGGKYFFTRNMALRVDLQFANVSVTIPANPGAGQNGTDGEISGTEFGVGGAIEYHFGRGRVSPYFGGGLGISTASTTSKPAIVGTGVQGEVSNRIGGESQIGITAGTEISVGAIIGAEFFLFKELSLGAEYRVGALILSQADEEVKNNTVTVTTEGGSSTAIGIMSQGFITLAFYF